LDKERFDVLLVKNGYFTSREKARVAILAGAVFVDDKKENKPSFKVSPEAKIEVRENVHPYVSRGGIKFLKAIEVFNLDLKDKVCLDIGASTGGFTDCILSNGAKKIYAVDVGSDQLAKKLREDNRVVSLEKTDIRTLSISDIDKDISFCSIDVSFISLRKVLPHIKDLFSLPYEIVCLVKPQFEAGKGKVGKNGVVKDRKIHFEVLFGLINFCIEQGFNIKGVDYSPIKGTEGNIEYLLYLSSYESLIKLEESSTIVKSTIEGAFSLLESSFFDK